MYQKSSILISCTEIFSENIDCSCLVKIDSFLSSFFQVSTAVEISPAPPFNDECLENPNSE